MAFRDPLKTYPTIDETNYLKPKIEKFLALNESEQFKAAIRGLALIRNSLLTAEKIGRLSEVAHRNHYMQAVQWLNKQTPITNFISIAQIENYENIDENVSTSLNSYVSQLISNLNSEVLYQQIQIMSAVIENTTIKNFIDKVQEPLETDFNRTLLDARTTAVETLGKTGKENEENINSLYNTQLESIRLAGVNAISSFSQARALASWSDFYGKRVEDYKLHLIGKDWPQDAVLKKWQTFKVYRRSLSRRERLKTSPQFVGGLSRCIRKAYSIFYSKVTSYSGKRAFWFSVLGLGVLISIGINILSIYEVNATYLGIDLSKLRPEHNDTQIFAKIALYIGVFLIPTIGYSFANKNYRIYSNLLEQYRHREVVAQTIQGILAKPRGDDNDDIVRKELSNVAAAALFEQKTVGHLSKNEANSTSIFDLARILKP